jgi:Protein of unknown function (DUF2439)
MQEVYSSPNQDTETRLFDLASRILIYDNQHENITDAFLSKYPNSKLCNKENFKFQNYFLQILEYRD